MSQKKVKQYKHALKKEVLENLRNNILKYKIEAMQDFWRTVSKMNLKERLKLCFTILRIRSMVNGMRDKEKTKEKD